MRSGICAVKLLMAFLMLMSCSNGNKSEYIVGKWKCDIAFPDMKGVEYITCKEDSTVIIVDSLFYAIQEDGLNVSVKCNVSNSGYWWLKEDILGFNLSKFDIDIDSTSLNISIVSDQLSIDSVQSDYLSFKKELLNHIGSQISAVFPDGEVGVVQIGKVQDTSSDILIMEKSGRNIVLERYSK